MVVAAEYRAAPLVLAPHDPPPWHYAELTLTEGVPAVAQWRALRRVASNASTEPGGVKSRPIAPIAPGKSLIKRVSARWGSRASGSPTARRTAMLPRGRRHA